MVHPVAAVEVGMVDGELIGVFLYYHYHLCFSYYFYNKKFLLVNPTKQQMQNSSLILTIAGNCTSYE